jgi:hypothetical protein
METSAMVQNGRRDIAATGNGTASRGRYGTQEDTNLAQKLTAAIGLLAEAIPDDKGFAALKDYATSSWEKIRMLQDMLPFVGTNAPENTTSVISFTS